MADEVQVEVDGAVAVITINRPQARNAVNAAVAKGIAAALDELDERKDVSVLVLKKDKVAHKHFTAPRIVSVLALIASIALLTQQSLQTWLIAGAYVVVATDGSPQSLAAARHLASEGLVDAARAHGVRAGD